LLRQQIKRALDHFTEVEVQRLKVSRPDSIFEKIKNLVDDGHEGFGAGGMVSPSPLFRRQV